MQKNSILTNYRTTYFEEINRRADKITAYFIFSFFIFGALLSFYYDTWAFGLGIGSLNLLLYLLARYVITNGFCSRLIISAVFAIYMLQFIGQMHGLAEMHFFFFINIAILIIYQDWRIMIPYTILTVVHHTILFYYQLQGYDLRVYFLDSENITIHTFLFHLGLAAFMAIVCGWWAAILKKGSKEDLENKITLENQLQLMQRNIEFAIELTKGNFDKSIEIDKQDELGNSLMNMRASLIEANKKDTQEKFVNRGFALISELLRSDSKDLEQLTYQVISQLVKYMKANQGGLFILQGEEEKDRHLNLISCYAYERKKYTKKRIEIGEGLVGQAALEKDTIYLTDIPDKYLSITSGLGSANPKSIVIIPIQSNEDLVGVIELASFSEFEAYEIEFLQKVGEALAASIISSTIHRKTNRLLTEAQALTEQMHSQEEEMRQNMEELQATQEEHERRIQEFKSLLAAKEQEILNLQSQLQ